MELKNGLMSMGSKEMKIPDIEGFRKYSKRKFKSARLRKKQISTLRRTYIKMSKKYRCSLISATTVAEIPPVEWWMFCINSIVSTMKIIERREYIPVVEPYGE